MRLGELGISRMVEDPKSGTLFRVAAQNHYGAGITTLLTEYVLGVRALDAAESGPEGSYPFEQSGKFGNNNYPMSNLHRWLNAAEEDWYRPAHERDLPPTADRLRYGEHPYAEEAGFLCRFSETLRKNLVWTDIPVLVRTGRGKAEPTAVSAAVFLPSRTEMNKGDELGLPEGSPLPLFYDHYIFKAVPAADQTEKYGRSWNPEVPEKGIFFDAPQIYDPKFGWWYLMRTPNTMYKFLERVMSPYGSVSFTYANNDVAGLRPLVNLRSDAEVFDVGETGPLYHLG